MKSIIILGAGGHGRVVAELSQLHGYERIVFLDREWRNMPRSGAWDVAGDLDELDAYDPAEWDCIVATGNNASRLEVLGWASGKGFHLPVLVHPKAWVSEYARIGAGTVVCAMACIGPFARIGRGCILNTGSIVDHDCIIQDAAHVSPGARVAGGVMVGCRSWIGIGATVREGIRIGNDVVVGAGAVVISDVMENSKVVGVPARPLPPKA